MTYLSDFKYIINRFLILFERLVIAQEKIATAPVQKSSRPTNEQVRRDLKGGTPSDPAVLDLLNKISGSTPITDDEIVASLLDKTDGNTRFDKMADEIIDHGTTL